MNIKDKNYLTIQGWMRTKLNLKGNELLAFSLIFGFSQDDESLFSGSQSYVAEWLGVSRSTANITLKKLVEKEYIIKIDNNKNGVVFCDYKTNHLKLNTLLENLTDPTPEIEQTPTPEIEHHITTLDITKDNILTWRTDFETYKKQLTEEYLILIKNQDFIKQQEEFHPNVDIRLSLKKSCTNFWATEAGWKHKKSKKSVNIDWKSTLTNAIDMNKVYKGPPGQQNQNSHAPKLQSLENYERDDS